MDRWERRSKKLERRKRRMRRHGRQLGPLREEHRLGPLAGRPLVRGRVPEPAPPADRRSADVEETVVHPWRRDRIAAIADQAAVRVPRRHPGVQRVVCVRAEAGGRRQRK